MSTVFICPSNTNIMPYLDLYTSCLERDDFKYLIWDRLANEELSPGRKYIYRDGKAGLSRSAFDYLFYAFYCIKFLLKEKHEKIVIFGPQLTFYLLIYLFFTNSRFIIDYRDYHPSTHFIPSFIFKKAFFVSISSPGFSRKLGSLNNILISHNCNYNFVHEECFHEKYLRSLSLSRSSKLSCIGSIRDYQANKHFISQVSNSDYIILFHGFSDVATDLSSYANQEGFNNCFFTGSYIRKDEGELYLDSGLINLLRLPDSFNNIVALPNRLYNCAKYRRPAFCYEGTELARLVSEYSLGVVLNYNNDLVEQINHYVDNFNIDVFNSGCEAFLLNVTSEQSVFNSELSKFYKS